MAIKPRWSPEINLGHILQAVTILGVVGGGAVTSYIALRSDIADAKSGAERQVSALGSRVGVLEARGAADEDFRRRTNDKLDELLKLVYGLKGEVGQRAERK